MISYDYRICPVGIYEKLNGIDSLVGYDVDEFLLKFCDAKRACFIIKGIPASGKSTIAAKLGLLRCNRDEIRESLFDNFSWKTYKLSKESESKVTEIWDEKFNQIVERGLSFTIDDMNVNPRYENALITRLIQSYYTPVVIFMDTPVSVCLDRDSERINPVGHKAIRRIYNEWIHFQRKDIICENILSESKNVVICDIDGTITEKVSRGFYEWNKVDTDKPRANVIEMVVLYKAAGYEIVFLSGRDSSCKDKTIKWLSDNLGEMAFELYMRNEGDMRSDNIVKHELFVKHILGRRNVKFVLDDRDKVVNLWRYEFNLPTLQVEYGGF